MTRRSAATLLLATILTAGAAADSDSLPAGLTAADVSALRADAAARAGVAVAHVAVQDASTVTWPDGALGCPQPGMVYTQALVHGHKVVLAANGRSWPYHLAFGRWVLCGGSGPLAGGALPGEHPGGRSGTAPVM